MGIFGVFVCLFGSVSPFTGTSLFDVLAFLRRPSPPTFPSVSVKFDTAQPAVSPIILHLRPHLDLLFTRHTQRLHTISLSLRRNAHSHPPLVLSYKSEVLSGPDVVLTRTAVQRTMGPTYKGERMKYPGVWFSFDEDTPGAVSGGGVNTSDGNTEVKRIVLTQRQESGEGEKEESTDEVIPNSVMYGDIKRAAIKVSIVDAIFAVIMIYCHIRYTRGLTFTSTLRSQTQNLFASN